MNIKKTKKNTDVKLHSKKKYYKSKNKSKHESKQTKHAASIKLNKYPKIEGKYKTMFGITPKSLEKLHYELYELYSKSTFKNVITPAKIHQLLLKFFITEYYPIVSRNIKADSHTMAVILGGVAFNMNVPNKMRFLELETDDIDLKVYTTDINYSDRKPAKVARVLSVFRFVILITCMFLKQVFTEIINFGETMFESSNGHNGRKLTKKSSNTINKHIKKVINFKQRNFGIMKDGKIIIEFKLNAQKEKADLTTLAYNEIFNLVMTKVNDVDLLITNKFNYNINYNNVIKKNKNTIIFSDSKVIYPNIDYPSFYSYYFMNNRKIINNNIIIEKLIHQNIPIVDIIDTKYYSNSSSSTNNCRYVSVKTLLLDSCLMLSYAELLQQENIVKGNILVSVKSLFKYYKYFCKFIRLHIIKKFYNRTLNKDFVDAATKLQKYVFINLKRETDYNIEIHPINIMYKKIINDFHQSFFINKSILKDFKVLTEIVYDYKTNVSFINKSRALFKDLDIAEHTIQDDKDDKHSNDVSSDNNVSNSHKSKYKSSHKQHDLIESYNIQFANEKLAEKGKKGDIYINNNNDVDVDVDVMNGGRLISRRNTKIILYDNYLFEDIELDNKPLSHRIKNKVENKLITDKLFKMLNNEIKQLNNISKHIK